MDQQQPMGGLFIGHCYSIHIKMIQLQYRRRAPRLRPLALRVAVSGGAVGAKAANLAIMVGGDEAVFRKVLPVLETIGAKDQITHVGAIGTGKRRQAGA